MKQLKRLAALLLAISMCLSLAAPAYAASSADSSSFIEEMEEIPVAEESFDGAAADLPTGVIVGFGELDTQEITASGKPSLDSLLSVMPVVLPVILMDGQMAEIPVEWYCVGDYNDSDDYYYQFSPKWDTDLWPVGDAIDVAVDAPYVAVKLNNLKVNEDGSIPVSTKQPTVVSDSLTVVAREGFLTNSAASNKTYIFNFLTKELGMNNAAACGVMANIMAECSFNETAVGGGGSYGLCQWLGSRKTRLINWCKDNGFNYKTVEGQMHYLAYELPKYYPKVDSYLRACPNTAQGAYDAGYYWCYNYEIPSDTKNRSITRGNLAKNTFWPEYGNIALSKEPVISGESNPPETLDKGKGISVYGSISCRDALSKVVAGIYDAKGNLVSGKTVKPNTTSFNLNTLDNDILFSALTVGTYTYKVTVTTSSGTYTLIETKFKVVELANAPTNAPVEPEPVVPAEPAKPVEPAAPAKPVEPAKPETVSLAKVSGMKTVKTAVNQLSFTWDAVEGASGYEVYYCSAYNGTYKKLKTVTKPGYTTGTALKVGTDYNYKVRAVKGSATGSYSAILRARTDMDKSVVVATTSKLNVRKYAGTGYDILKVVAKNTKMTKLSQTKDKDGNAWIRVSFTSGSSTIEGYCMAKYMKTVSSTAIETTPAAPSAPAAPTTPSTSTTTTPVAASGKQLVITKDNLNLRKNATTDSVALVTVPAHTTLVVSGTSGKWYKASYTDEQGVSYTGYLSGDYLIVGARAKTTKTTYIYSKTTTSSNKNKTMSVGTRCLRLDKVKAEDGSEWYKVKFTKKGLLFSGYIQASLLQDY